MSYHGVPVTDNNGDFYGTLCHFDEDERDLTEDQFVLLQLAARIVPAYLPRQSAVRSSTGPG